MGGNPEKPLTRGRVETMKRKHCDISVVIPSHNEENNVIELHRQLTEVFSENAWDYEIIFIDDYSTDNTFANLARLAGSDTHLRIIKLAQNCGQTAATKAGFDHAAGNIIVSMDSDLEHAPEDIPAIVAAIEEGSDFVSTWRFDRVKEKAGKRIPSKVSNSLARLMTGVPAHDFGSGFKGYKRDVVSGLPMYGSFHRYVVAIAARRGYRFSEVKIRHRVRVDGVSHYGPERLMRGLFDLCYITLMLRFPKGRISRFLRGLADRYYYSDRNRSYVTETIVGFQKPEASREKMRIRAEDDTVDNTA